MKLSYYLVPAALLAAAPLSEAITIFSKVHDLVSDTFTNGGDDGSKTVDYVFTQPGVGGAPANTLTLRAVYRGIVGGTSTQGKLISHGGTRVGKFDGLGGNADPVFQGGGFTGQQGFSVNISLLDAGSNVNRSSVKFSMDAIGLRSSDASGNSGTGTSYYSWVTNNSTADPNASLDASTQGKVTTERLYKLDSAPYEHFGTSDNYTASFQALTTPGNGRFDPPNYLQLSDVMAPSTIESGQGFDLKRTDGSDYPVDPATNHGLVPPAPDYTRVDYEFSEIDPVTSPLVTTSNINIPANLGLVMTATFEPINALATPEPSSSALLGLGGLALILRRRR